MVKYSFRNMNGEVRTLINPTDISFAGIRDICDQNNVKYAVCIIPNEPEMGKDLLIAMQDPWGYESVLIIGYEASCIDVDGKPIIVPNHTLEEVIENHIHIDDESKVIERGNGTDLMLRDSALTIYCLIEDWLAISRITTDNVGPITFPYITPTILEDFLQQEGVMYTKFDDDRKLGGDGCMDVSQSIYVGVSENGDRTKQSLVMELGCFTSEASGIRSFGISRGELPKSISDHDRYIYKKVHVFDGEPLDLELANDILGRYIINNFYYRLRFDRVIAYLRVKGYAHTLITNAFTETNTIVIEYEDDIRLAIEYRAIHHYHKYALTDQQYAVQSVRFLTNINRDELQKCSNSFVTVTSTEGKIFDHYALHDMLLNTMHSTTSK